MSFKGQKETSRVRTSWVSGRLVPDTDQKHRRTHSIQELYPGQHSEIRRAVAERRNLYNQDHSWSNIRPQRFPGRADVSVEAEATPYEIKHWNSTLNLYLSLLHNVNATREQHQHARERIAELEADDPRHSSQPQNSGQTHQQDRYHFDYFDRSTDLVGAFNRYYQDRHNTVHQSDVSTSEAHLEGDMLDEKLFTDDADDVTHPSIGYNRTAGTTFNETFDDRQDEDDKNVITFLHWYDNEQSRNTNTDDGINGLSDEKNGLFEVVIAENADASGPTAGKRTVFMFPRKYMLLSSDHKGSSGGIDDNMVIFLRKVYYALVKQQRKDGHSSNASAYLPRFHFVVDAMTASALSNVIIEEDALDRIPSLRHLYRYSLPIGLSITSSPLTDDHRFKAWRSRLLSIKSKDYDFSVFFTGNQQVTELPIDVTVGDTFSQQQHRLRVAYSAFQRQQADRAMKQRLKEEAPFVTFQDLTWGTGYAVRQLSLAIVSPAHRSAAALSRWKRTHANTYDLMMNCLFLMQTTLMMTLVFSCVFGTALKPRKKPRVKYQSNRSKMLL